MEKKTVFEKAQWIWNAKKYDENEYSEFTDEFAWDEGKVLLNISARGDYTLFVNGEYAESNQYGDFEQYKVYDRIDITKYLSKGKNRISVLVWYFGKAGYRYFTPEAGLIYEVINGDNIVACSDINTLSRKSKAYMSGLEKKISGQLGYSFLYNSNSEDEWLKGSLTGFSDSAVIPGTKELYIRPIEKHRVGEIIVGEVSEVGNNRYVIDLGEEIVGLCSFSLISERSQNINVSYGEILKDGHVKRKIWGRDFSFDYVAKLGENTYTNYMLRLACRYLEVESEFPVDIKYIGILPQEYPVTKKKVEFESELDNRIYEACVNTLKLCMMEHYVDCPWREQCMYAYDSRNQMLSGYFAFEGGNFDYARANLLLMSKDNRADGLLSMTFPSSKDMVIPSFSLYYVLAVKEYTKYSGDLSLAEEVFGKIESVMKKFADNVEDDIVCKFIGKCYWNFYDWTEYADNWDEYADDMKDKMVKTDFLINSIFVVALGAFEYICKKIGKENRYDGLKERISKKAREVFFNDETGMFYISRKDEKPTELANSVAVVSGIADGELSKEICEKLSEGGLLETSLSTKCFKYDALIKCNKEKYKETVLNEIRKTYKIMLDSGSKTVWEVFEGASAFDDAGSLCHGWSAIPVYYYQILSD